MCGVEQVKYQIPGATGISLQLQMITLLGDAAAAGFTINLFNAQPIMSWPEPGCMALVMVLMKNTLMRIAVLSANCQSGVWKQSGNSSWRVGATFQVWPGQAQTLGRFKLCINSYRIDGKEMAETQVIPTDEPDSNGNMNWYARNSTQYSGYYMGIHCFI